MNPKSKYKYVYSSIRQGRKLWSAQFYRQKTKLVGTTYFKTEREAALAVDKHLISEGREPVNILKRKN